MQVGESNQKSVGKGGVFPARQVYNSVLQIFANGNYYYVRSTP
jgi:hypothetical protein